MAKRQCDANLIRNPELRERLKYQGSRRLCDAYTHPRLLDVPKHLRGRVLNWSVHDQAEAVDRGFFLERCTTDNHVRVIPTKKTFDTDKEVVDTLMMQAFLGDSFAGKAMAFIEQQDTYAYSSVWDDRISTYNQQLRWYKIIKYKQRQVNTSKTKVKA